MTRSPRHGKGGFAPFPARPAVKSHGLARGFPVNKAGMQTDICLAVLGKVPSGLFIVTAAREDKRAAFLGSFVQQASFEPVIFSIAVHPDRYPYSLISKSKRFALNVVPENDEILLKTFAKGHGPETDPISGVDHEYFQGMPLLKDAIGGAVFEVVSEIKPGDHAIVFGRALDGKIFHADKKPWVHVRKSAKNY